MKNSIDSIERKILENKGKKIKLIRLSENENTPLGYYNFNKSIKNILMNFKYHHYGHGLYLGENPNVIKNYTNIRKYEEAVKVEVELILNRHFDFTQMFNSSLFNKLFFELPPNPFLYLFIEFFVKKYDLDSYQVPGINIFKKITGKIIYKTDLSSDGTYFVIRDVDKKIENGDLVIKKIIRI